MPLLKRLHKIDRDIEKRLLTGLIMSDKVTEKLLPFLQKEVLELDVSKEIVSWIKDYHSRYKKAPKGHIRDLFLTAKQKLRPQVIEEIEQFLSKLSEEYLTDSGPGGINEDFIIDRGLQYLRERHMRTMIGEVSSLLEVGEVEKAEKIAEGRKSIILKTDYRWVKPLDDLKYLNAVFDELENPLFTLKGQLGELIGPFYRKWLVGVMGPFKRGKTWDLQDIGVDAVLSGLRVAFSSLEMEDKHQSVRLYSQVGQLGEVEMVHEIPCFDCCSNQDDSCIKRIRIRNEGRPEKFQPNQSYRPCTACRGIKKEEKDFLATSWFILEEHEALTRETARREVSRLKEMAGSNLLRMISYPAFSATLTDVEDDLDRLEVQEGFIPDVIIIDYADILAPEDKRKEHRHQIDEIWKRLKGMAFSRSCLVVSGSQGNRASADKKTLDEKDIAEEARKLAHADVWLGLNQDQQEKERGVWRIGVMEHRWKKFNKRRQLMALQKFEIGQPILDGEIIYYEHNRQET
jgi:hypothetical protein